MSRHAIDRRAVAACAALFIVGGCADDVSLAPVSASATAADGGDARDAGGDDASGADAAPIALAVHDLAVEASADVGLTVWVSFRSDVAADGSVDVETEGEPGRSVRPEVAGATDAHRILVLGLLADREYTFTARVKTAAGVGSATTTFHTAPLPTPFPKIVATVTPPYAGPDGYIVFAMNKLDPATAVSTNGRNNPVPANDDFPDTGVIVDAKGRVVWYKRFVTLTERLQGFALLPNGHFAALGWEGYMELDLAGRIVRHLTLKDLGASTALHHDAVLLPNGNYLSLTSHSRQPDWMPESVAIDDVIEFTPGGAIVGYWPLDAYIPLTLPMTLATIGGYRAIEQDPYHTNALAYDPATDEVTASVYGVGRIVRFERSTGKRVWVLGAGGDVRLEPSDAARGTHGLQCLPDGSVLTYDNGAGPFPAQGMRSGRALRYVVAKSDAGGYEAKLAWKHAADSVSPWMGNVEALGGNLNLVCNGARVVSVSPPKTVPTIEIVTDDSSSTAVFRLEIDPDGIGTFRPEEATAPGTLLVYRAYHIADLGEGQR